MANEQAESHKNICTMQLERLMIVNAMPAAMNRSSKLPSMRSLFVYALAYRSISKMVHLRRTKHTCATVLLGFRKFHKKGDKEGALVGFRSLEKAKLGKVEVINPKRGTAVVSKCLHNFVYCYLSHDLT